MARGSVPVGLILDAVVLIDFCLADRRILKLVTEHIGQVHVATPVLAEVRQLRTEDCDVLGIKLIEPTLAQSIVAATRRGKLSFQDQLCLVLAKANGWTCVTNDKRLRRECENDGLHVLWGLQTVLLLVKCAALSYDEAMKVAEAIRDGSPHFITEAMLAEFKRKLEALGQNPTS